MDEEYIDKATDEYLDVVKNSEKSFARFNPVLPLHIKMKIDRESQIIKQAKLTSSIYIRAAVMQYLEHVKKVYNYEDLDNIDATLQLPLQLSNECYDDLEMIANIIGTNAKTSIIKRAIEYSFGQPITILKQ